MMVDPNYSLQSNYSYPANNFSNLTNNYTTLWNYTFDLNSNISNNTYLSNLYLNNNS